MSNRKYETLEDLLIDFTNDLIDMIHSDEEIDSEKMVRSYLDKNKLC